MPHLPKELYRPSAWGSAAYIGYSVALWWLPAWAAVRLMESEAALGWKLLGLAPLMLLAQQGIHLLGWVGHEGFHFSLHRNKHVSALLGIVFSSMLLSFFQVGVALTHWVHHRYTNHPVDPDWQIFSRYQTFWSRLLLARARANRVFLRNLLRVAFNRPLDFPYIVPFKPGTVRLLAWVNIACSLGWLSLYLYLSWERPLLFLVGVLLPHAVGFVLTGPRPYLEHAGTEVGTFRDARTYSSPLFTALLLGNNYHLEHHLYPAVPCYRLPRVHRMLREQGLLERAGSPVEATLLGALRHATARSRYPAPVEPVTAEAEAPTARASGA